MVEIDPQALLDQATLLGLMTRDQARLAREDATDGGFEALKRVVTRKQYLTSWQIDRLAKGESGGFFYGGCKILFHIAEGTFARVYRGRRVHGEQAVAVKVLRQRFVSDPGAVERFNHEAEAGMKLVHPNIVRILDYGADDNRHYMIMEYVEGSNLRDFLKFRTRLEPREAMPLIIGLAHGLQHSLSKGITHRDIKGTNILIGSNGVAKLVDFGLATIEGDERKMAAAHGTRTVDYSALERTCGSPKGDPRSDIYFLGCVYYQMLTGVLPLPEVETSDPLAKMLKRSFGAIKPLSDMRHAPDPELSRVIERMMRMDLTARYQNMDDVVADLEKYYSKLMGKSRKEEVRNADEMDLENAFARRAEEPEGAGFEVAAFKQRNVLCVEAQPAIQEAFKKTLGRAGYRVILVSDAERGAERYREAPADVVVFDLDGLGVDALDSFLDMHEKAHEDGNELSAVVLLGPKQADYRDRLPTDDRLSVLVKPIKMKDVQDALDGLAPARAG